MAPHGPQAVIKQHGAEILRLWVAAQDYQEDLRISLQILKQLIEAYRKMRNTCRAIVVQAIDERARAFYGQFGFRPFSDLEPLMLILRISELGAQYSALKMCKPMHKSHINLCKPEVKRHSFFTPGPVRNGSNYSAHRLNSAHIFLLLGIGYCATLHNIAYCWLTKHK